MEDGVILQSDAEDLHTFRHEATQDNKSVKTRFSRKARKKACCKASNSTGLGKSMVFTKSCM